MTAAASSASGEPVDAIVVGAGLAGLCAARHLQRAGRSVTVIEASDGVGGRVRSDMVDGFTLDRGFQVLLTAYPEATRQLDLGALELRAFDPGAAVRVGSRFHVVGDPLRQPATLWSTSVAPIGSPIDKLRLLALRRRVRRTEPAQLLRGTDEATIEQTLRFEVMAMQDRHKAGKKFFDLIKLYGPGYGLVGTLVGQVGMFGKLATADIGELGAALALAVVATMYGAIIANAVAGPMGDKLALRSGEEILGREMMLQGILSIQAGDNPRATLDRMLAFLPHAHREKLNTAA